MIESNVFDKERIYPNCTVQILTNSITGEESIGWWVNKKKTKPLVWWVYISDFNRNCIKKHNVFNHYRFYQDCRKNYRKNKERADFVEQLRKDLMYYYWSKCEWEIVLQHWPPRENFHDEKIDVYEQVRMNWSAFSDYVWDNRRELRWKDPRRQSNT